VIFADRVANSPDVAGLFTSTASNSQAIRILGSEASIEELHLPK
jgi:hypothetical protein